jgi:hypothetical protein
MRVVRPIPYDLKWVSRLGLKVLRRHGAMKRVTAEFDIFINDSIDSWDDCDGGFLLVCA